ncbi:spore germination protein [Paenibacillus doosanensis]|uniref:GerAB/ArcD/ProY family transporter n=1 Tax=Paenibacillus doosanensis TaxID=1229154 RepID=UPI0021800E82|nr:spore germination protein [Paenibacillus doosanensis]MCS7464218.1 spore germination protein [Paenibacillus doosanensis]
MVDANQAAADRGDDIIHKENISAGQMGMMMFLMVGATAILAVPSITAKHAGRDMWLSPIWGSLSGFLVVYIAWRLHALYPNKTPIQYSEMIVGQYVGKAVGFVFLFLLLQGAGGVVREYGEFISVAFLPETPVALILFSLILVGSFAVYAGVEVLARCTQVFFPVLLILFLTLILMLSSDLSPENMLPVMEKGLKASFAGSLVPHSWFVQFFFSSFLFPALGDQRGMRFGMLSVFVLMVVLVITNMTCLFLFGEKLAAGITFPAFQAVRYISIADFLAHLESIAMAFWIVGGFVQISLWYYSLVVGVAQWLKLPDYRALVFPCGLLIVINGFWGMSHPQKIMMFLSTTGVFYKLSVLLLLPALLLCIAWIRRRRGGGGSQPPAPNRRLR